MAPETTKTTTPATRRPRAARRMSFVSLAFEGALKIESWIPVSRSSLMPPALSTGHSFRLPTPSAPRTVLQ